MSNFFTHNLSSLSSTEGRPVIWGYRDPRAFLTDLSAWLREHVDGFSFRRIALEAGLRSPNYVQQYLSGKRTFKEKTLQPIAGAYGLSNAETEMLLLLNSFSQALRVHEKRDLYRQILRVAIRHGSGQLDQARLAYFSHWYIPVIHAMASLQGFQPSAKAIAPMLAPRIKVVEARQALEILYQLGIFTTDQDGAFLLAEPQLETSPDIRSIWIQEYHEAMIGMASGSIARWESTERNTSALTVTVRHDQIDWLMKKIDTFRDELFSELMGTQESEDQVQGDVFQINLQAFPLTRFHVTPAKKQKETP